MVRVVAFAEPNADPDNKLHEWKHRGPRSPDPNWQPAWSKRYVTHKGNNTSGGGVSNALGSSATAEAPQAAEAGSSASKRHGASRAKQRGAATEGQTDPAQASASETSRSLLPAGRRELPAEKLTLPAWTKKHFAEGGAKKTGGEERAEGRFDQTQAPAPAPAPVKEPKHAASPEPAMNTSQRNKQRREKTRVKSPERCAAVGGVTTGGTGIGIYSGITTENATTAALVGAAQSPEPRHATTSPEHAMNTSQRNKQRREKTRVKTPEHCAAAGGVTTGGSGVTATTATEPVAESVEDKAQKAQWNRDRRTKSRDTRSPSPAGLARSVSPYTGDTGWEPAWCKKHYKQAATGSTQDDPELSPIRKSVIEDVEEVSKLNSQHSSKPASQPRASAPIRQRSSPSQPQAAPSAGAPAAPSAAPSAGPSAGTSAGADSTRQSQPTLSDSLFDEIDTNQDGLIDRAEFENAVSTGVLVALAQSPGPRSAVPSATTSALSPVRRTREPSGTSIVSPAAQVALDAARSRRGDGAASATRSLLSDSLVDEIDTNQDAAVVTSSPSATSSPLSDSLFDKIDTNQDGLIDRDEFDRALDKSWLLHKAKSIAEGELNHVIANPADAQQTDAPTRGSPASDSGGLDAVAGEPGTSHVALEVHQHVASPNIRDRSTSPCRSRHCSPARLEQTLSDRIDVHQFMIDIQPCLEPERSVSPLPYRSVSPLPYRSPTPTRYRSTSPLAYRSGVKLNPKLLY